MKVVSKSCLVGFLSAAAVLRKARSETVSPNHPLPPPPCIQLSPMKLSSLPLCAITLQFFRCITICL
jgi:hypothetical protein